MIVIKGNLSLRDRKALLESFLKEVENALTDPEHPFRKDGENGNTAPPIEVIQELFNQSKAEHAKVVAQIRSLN
jgi:hypothetical protein